MISILLLFVFCLALNPQTAFAAESGNVEAVYLGVQGYGSESVNKDNIESFKYRFKVNGKEKIYSIDSGAKQADGEYAYPVQNVFKEGYSYRLTVDGDTVKKAKEISTDDKNADTALSCKPGKKTLKNFLTAALEPMGTTLYIYGGGWNWQDNAAGQQACTIHAAPEWKEFFDAHGKNYTYRDKDGDSAKKNPATSYYPYGGYNEYYYAGLDCSGYVGWVVYNTMKKKSGGSGYVGFASDMAYDFAKKGWGKWTHNPSEALGAGRTKPGDIISLGGHIWISLGECSDGSTVIAHSTPNMSRTGQPGGGVQLSAIGTSKSCEAYKLCDKYMKKHFKKWYKRYPVDLKDASDYFAFSSEKTGRFRWNTDGSGILKDEEGLQEMSAEEVLEELF